MKIYLVVFIGEMNHDKVERLQLLSEFDLKEFNPDRADEWYAVELTEVRFLQLHQLKTDMD